LLNVGELSVQLFQELLTKQLKTSYDARMKLNSSEMANGMK